MRPSRHLRVGVLAAAVIVAAGATTALADTSSTTATVTSVSGGLSVTAGAPAVIASTTIGATGGTTGNLPTATFVDATGSGSGWHGSVAVSSLSYTGLWIDGLTGTTLSTAVDQTQVGQYTGTANGVWYKVHVTAVSGSTVDFDWTSNDATDASGGSGSATAAVTPTPVAVGSKGVQIAFLTAPSVGADFSIHVGTQSADAITLGTAIGLPTGMTAQNSGTTVTGGGVGVLGTAVTFVSAATLAGIGTNAVTPVVSVALDPNSWATTALGGQTATYSADVQYSIASGP